MTTQPVTPLTNPALSAAADSLRAALDDCAAKDIPILDLSLYVDHWYWLADALRDAADGLDATAALAQFAEQLDPALAEGGAS